MLRPFPSPSMTFTLNKIINYSDLLMAKVTSTNLHKPLYIIKVCHRCISVFTSNSRILTLLYSL